MVSNPAIGTRVVLRDTYSTRYGNVFEVGIGRQEGRIRVKWSYSVGVRTGNKTEDTKRTWIAADRLELDLEPAEGETVSR